MKVRVSVCLLLVLTLITVAGTSSVWAQVPDENAEAAGQDDVAAPLPDEEIGDAVVDPSQLLDTFVESDPYAVEEVVEPAGEVEPSEADEALADDALLSNGVPVQGRLTDAAGMTLSGSYSIRLALYTVASRGAAVCVDTDTVNVVRGLFSTVLNGCTAGDISGQQLYLGIKVGSDPEMTPRQALYATPYAHSLRPGAIVSNTGSGHGLTLRSSGGGLANSALWADNAHASGIAVWARTSGSDATIVSSNNGSGALFKGFGSDGGEDEFRINNNGALETKADTYLWIPGDAFIKNRSDDSTRWDIQNNGAARLWRGATAGTKYIYFPITLPSVLYGQPVEIERVTVYYKCQDGTDNYITETYMYKQTDADSSVTIISDATDRTSNIATSYTLILSNDRILSAGQGGLGLNLGLRFANDTDYIQVAGIRLQLGHHDLY